MAKEEIIKTFDTAVIESITPVNNALAELIDTSSILELEKRRVELEAALAEKREEVRMLETNLDKLKSTLAPIKNAYTINYKAVEKKIVTNPEDFGDAALKLRKTLMD